LSDFSDIILTALIWTVIILLECMLLHHSCTLAQLSWLLPDPNTCLTPSHPGLFQLRGLCL